MKLCNFCIKHYPFSRTAYFEMILGLFTKRSVKIFGIYIHIYIHIHVCIKQRTNSVACRYVTIEVKVIEKKMGKYLQIIPEVSKHM